MYTWKTYYDSIFLFCHCSLVVGLHTINMTLEVTSFLASIGTSPYTKVRWYFRIHETETRVGRYLNSWLNVYDILSNSAVWSTWQFLIFNLLTHTIFIFIWRMLWFAGQVTSLCDITEESLNTRESWTSNPYKICSLGSPSPSVEVGKIRNRMGESKVSLLFILLVLFILHSHWCWTNLSGFWCIGIQCQIVYGYNFNEQWLSCSNMYDIPSIDEDKIVFTHMIIVWTLSLIAHLCNPLKCSN